MLPTLGVSLRIKEAGREAGSAWLLGGGGDEGDFLFLWLSVAWGLLVFPQVVWGPLVGGWCGSSCAGWAGGRGSFKVFGFIFLCIALTCKC